MRLMLLLMTLALAAQNAAPTIQFRDITRQAGIAFEHSSGASGRKFLPETLGPGCVFFDFDGDGLQDIFFVNGKSWPGQPARPSSPRLYHNDGNSRFSDVTRPAGLAQEIYGLGASAADFDNDGDDDLFVTALGQSLLYRNNGNRTFTDVTRNAGLANIEEFSTSAAFLDYDNDGFLDLFVANYVQWSPQSDLFCTLDGSSKSYCTPESYKGTSSRLWRNRGNATFEDVSRKAGIYDPSAKSLGVAVLDYNRDGFLDIAVANDTERNKLYVNNGKGGFSEKGVLAGMAFSEDGVARAGMGIDAADYDRSGAPSLLITNFSNQMLSLYHNEGRGLFIDEASRSGIGRPSLLTLGFGCFFFDYDLDGWLDIFVANGHIESDIERIQKRVTYAQAPHMFRNLGKGKFQETTTMLGADFNRKRVARGAAYADIDNDGDLDLLLAINGGPASLFENSGTTNKSLRIQLLGRKSNRNGIGATVEVVTGTDRSAQMLRSGSSYLSQSELRMTFGLGGHAKADELVVRWPGGQIDRISNVAAGHTILIEEGRGQISARPFSRKGPAR